MGRREPGNVLQGKNARYLRQADIEVCYSNRNLLIIFFDWCSYESPMDGPKYRGREVGK